MKTIDKHKYNNVVDVSFSLILVILLKINKITLF